MLATATVADLLRPSQKTSALIYNIVLVIGGSLILALSAHLKVFLPFSSVPVTAQTFTVLMIGALLGAKLGTLAVIAYLIEGIIGLPFFTSGGGFAALTGLTGGYLIGFIPAAYLTGFLAQKGWDRKISTTILAMILGNLVIYTFGLLWLAHLVGISKSLAVGIYPFILGDLLKIFLAAALLPTGWKLLKYGGLGYKRR
ncbi:MAG: biotin transporter BioY [Sedimentisphaerales bacterium]|nr:biotin transporter BioY [Sedimentisphaerales bacterium]